MSRRSILALLPLSLFNIAAAPEYVKPVKEKPDYLCKIHGPLFKGEVTSVFGKYQVSENYKDHSAGPVCVYCQVDYLQSKTPKLDKI